MRSIEHLLPPAVQSQAKKRQVISNTKPKSAVNQPVPATIAAMQASLTSHAGCYAVACRLP